MINGTITVVESGKTESFTLDNPGSSTFFARSDGNGGTLIDDVACYCAGTQVRTEAGERPVEALAIGDRLVTASGAHRPVRWIGRRHLDLTRHPDPIAARPVRVSAGAFGEGLPVRDLWMSPGHCLFVEGVLIPIRSLINDASVVQVAVTEVTYWHVEFDSHDLILAERLPAESYLDTGNRWAFENGDGPMALHPHFEPLDAEDHAAGKCARVVSRGPEVQAARALLAARLPALGHETTTAHDLHLVAGGRRIEAVVLGPRRLAFVVTAEGSTDLALISRAFVPWRADPRRTDDRLLGVLVKRLQIDGEEVDLGALDTNEGWHRLEVRPQHVQRWTNGAAVLPAGARLVVVDLAGDGRYPIPHRDNVIALRA